MQHTTFSLIFPLTLKSLKDSVDSFPISGVENAANELRWSLHLNDPTTVSWMKRSDFWNQGRIDLSHQRHTVLDIHAYAVHQKQSNARQLQCRHQINPLRWELGRWVCDKSSCRGSILINQDDMDHMVRSKVKAGPWLHEDDIFLHTYVFNHSQTWQKDRKVWIPNFPPGLQY